MTTDGTENKPEVIHTPTLGDPMVGRDLTDAEIHEIQSGLMIPSQGAAKRMARMIRVLQGDEHPDYA